MTIVGGAVAQRLECAADNRVVAGSNPTEAACKLWQLPLLAPLYQCLSEDTKRCWSPPYGVHVIGSKISHTEGKCVTCRGLHILPGHLGRVHTTGLKPERFQNRSSCPCSHLFHCVHSFRYEPTTSRCDRSGTVPEPFRLALWCERSTGPVPERVQSERSLRKSDLRMPGR